MPWNLRQNLNEKKTQLQNLRKKLKVKKDTGTWWGKRIGTLVIYETEVDLINRSGGTRGKGKISFSFYRGRSTQCSQASQRKKKQNKTIQLIVL